MGSEENVMGIPQLLHFQTMITTGALFLGIIGVSFLSNSTGTDSLIITFLIACLALGLLVFSADFFIEGAKGLARRGGLPEVVIGLTIVSIGTSLPEILVSTTAAADVASKPEVADFAIGGILGSVFVQITLILGIVVVNKGFKIRESWLKRDGLIMLLAVLILTFFLLTERTLQRWESGILVLLYVIYIVWLLMHRKVIQMEEDENKEEVEVRGSTWSTAAYTIMVIGGLAFRLICRSPSGRIRKSNCDEIECTSRYRRNNCFRNWDLFTRVNHCFDGGKEKPRCCDRYAYWVQYYRPTAFHWFGRFSPSSCHKPLMDSN